MIPLLLAVALSVSTPGARVTLSTVDAVERQFTAIGQRNAFVGVFSTRYAFHGRPIDAQAFWTSIRPGTVLDVKTRIYPNFNVLLVSQINVP